MPKPIRRRMLSRRTAALTVLVAFCGCEDVDWDWERQEWTRSHRPIRPSRRRVPPDYNPYRPDVRTGSPPTKAGARPGTTEDGVRTDASRPGGAPQPVGQAQHAYYKLYLISGSASMKVPPNSKKIRLERADSRAAVDVLHMIYPSIGPSGGEGQRFLLYQHEPMWAAAGEFAPLLDCPDRAKPPPTDPADPTAAFQAGVGLVYRLRRPGQQTDFEGFRRSERLMAAAYQSDRASGQLRWGAAMLAGQIAAETLSEFARAQKHYEQARAAALSGSVEAMIAVYYLADTCVHEGQRDRAAQIAQGFAEKFAAHRASRIYERASALAGPR